MMKNLTIILLFALNTGCFLNTNKTQYGRVYDIEIVEVKGRAIIENSKEQARKLAINDALKNAVDAVVGVYISANTLVSKSVLIEEEIRSNTQGYIEKYEIIKEYEENNFYVVKIKAYVKKEDILIKANKIENEIEKIGSPIVAVDIKDIRKPDFKWAESFLIGELKNDHFRISSSTTDADLIIYAEIDTYFNTAEGIGGFISYICNISGKIYSNNNELIGGFSQTGAGIGINNDDARSSASVNCVRKSYPIIKDYIISFYSSKRILEFEIENVRSIVELNDVIRFFKNIAQIRNIYVKNYSDYKAKIDLVVYKGNWQDIYSTVVKNDIFEIKKFSKYSILAVKK